MTPKHDILKRTLSLVLALVMTASCVPFQAFAAETETIAPTEAVETTPAETTAPTEPPVPETVPETTAETTAQTIPETTETTVPATTEETVPEIAVPPGETAPVLLSEPLDLSAYQGKVISILGASTCTFAGYIPVADGFNLEHYARYPQDNLLTDVNDTWWMQVINTLDAKLGINDSWRSTEVYNACTEEVNSSYDGTKACLSSITRIQNLGSNGTPDVILFFGGINDITQRRPLGTFNAASAPKTVDLTAETWETVAEAYTALIMRLQYYYPSAKIVALLPYSISSNSNAVTARYTSVFAEICKHYGVSCIDLMDCGISTGDLPDGTHPNAEGMDYITEAVLQTLAESVNMEAGENVVYSVSHKLNGAKASLGYYKGVSAGTAFVETLEGEALSVTVTMGGKDITASAYVNGKVSIPKVTGDLVITAKGIYDVDGRLQKLPDIYCCNTNLWTQLEPVNEYYTPSGWGNNSNSNYSVTFPVTAGDHIWATSFGAAGTNGYSANAVRITWFGENGVLKSLDREAVYGEFAEYGYLTVPEGAVALNIPMATNSTDWEIYILNRPHSYSGGKCTSCGKQNILSNYQGKVISILGDSISTFAGYIPVVDGFNLEHYARYPQNNLLTDVKETWWMQVITELDAKLGINESWRSTEVYNHIDEEVNSTYDGTKACMASTTRIQNLGSNGTPDVILFYGGTNDITQRRTVGTFDPTTAPTTVDLTSVKWDTVADAYVAAIMRMQYYYPNAEIIAMLPTYTSNNTDAVIEKYNSVFASICDHYGVTWVDLRDCGITTSDLPDGTHPNATGMDYITEAVLETLGGVQVEAGEHVVYSVTHTLSNAEASLGYYQGISAGAAFSETITGENLSVTVTMGGKDITASAYANGKVSIPSVTGALSITAKAGFSLGSRLQALPETVCAGTNLWAALKPVNEYYTASGWGNLSSGNAWSVTIPVSAGEKIYATSFEAYGANGNTDSTSSGIRVTYFGADGVLKALSPTETYAEFSASGYLTAPAGATAMNVPMWNGSAENELYLLNRPHSYSGGKCISCGEAAPSLAGKTLSILGASISTFEGTSNGAAADTTNSTIRKNAKYYPNTTIPEVTLNDTWWMQVCEDLGLRLLVNNAWSGSSLLYERGGTVGAYVDRCVQLHDDTGDNAGETPDIIGIQMGTNDFQYYKDTLGTADIDYTALIQDKGDGTFTYAEPTTSLEAAAIVLHKISVRYPNAEVYYLNISQRVDGTDDLIRRFNADLKKVVEHFGAHIVDIYNSAITMEDFDTYIGDGRVHPNKLGMDAYTEAFKKSLLANTGYVAPETHTVSFDLTGVTADYGTEKIVLDGDSFSVKLSPLTGDTLGVHVTMDGQSVTDTVGADGIVTIEAVTGDVVIEAWSKHESQNYRWSFDGTDLVNSRGENALTKTAGTTGTNGIFSTTRYSLERPVMLLHDQPWVVEWRSEGTWKNTSGSGGRLFTTTPVNADYNARYIFKSSTNGLIALGEKTTTGSHNYGIALADHGINASAAHTYRLENRVSSDGSNMVWLYVDDMEIGPMTGYYIGTASQGTTSNWLNGKDFVLPYIGTDTHGLNNCSIDYVQVWEGGAPDKADDLGDFYGKTLSILGDSISTFSGVSNNTSYNSTIGSNAVYYSNGTLGITREDTWWQQTIDALGMELLVNNSWSGSTVFYPRKGAESVGYGPRCENLHNDKTGEEPDVITVFLGTNDFSYYQDTLGTADAVDYASLVQEKADGSYTIATPATTCEAYALMLRLMTLRYPDADIYCMTLTARRDPDKADSYADVGQPTAFNAELKKIIEFYGCTVVDLENCGIPKNAADFDYYMGDGRVHPNEEGMDKITQALINAMVGEQLTWYTVSSNAELDVMDFVPGGMGFGCMLPTGAGIRVSATMGGVDITAQCVTDSSMHIPEVTGDIVITVTREPQSYRWEFNGTDLTSITIGGNTGNGLTKLAGTTTNGVFSDTRYDMVIPVELRHNEPWIIEWRGEGAGGFMLSDNTSSSNSTSYFFRRAGNYLNAFGHYRSGSHHNYGLALTDTEFDGAAMHTYRLVNEIAADGSNMVSLYVDGQKAGDLTQYYIGGTDYQNPDTWISGQDFTFRYIGTTSHPLTNYAMEYLQIWEGGCTHSYETEVTAPTCTEQGYTTHTCTCGDSYVDTYVNATGHTYGTWTVTTAATCTAKGTERRDCNNCDHYETREIAAKGHTEVIDKAVAATCTATGLTEGKHCSVCNTVLTAQTTIPAKGHTWDNGKVTKEPTEQTAGVKTYTCTTCGATKTEVIPSLNHTHKYTDKITAPTCTEKGYTTHTCTCGDSYVDNYVNATGHTYGSWTVTTAATCTAKGTERRDCASCDHYETREIAAKGHTEVTDKAVAATCTATGLTEGKHCSVCGTVLVAQKEVAALGHSWDVGVVTKDPTESEEGESVFTCQTCGETKTQKLPMLSHTHEHDSTVTPPTCTAQGYTTHTCSCGDGYVDSYVEATGHTAGEWISDKTGHWRICESCDEILDIGIHDGSSCTICGHETPSQDHGFKPGDVNHDGKINAKDSTLILQYSVGVLKDTAFFCDICAEVSGDGRLNAKDATLILQYSVGLLTEFPAQQ